MTYRTLLFFILTITIISCKTAYINSDDQVFKVFNPPKEYQEGLELYRDRVQSFAIHNFLNPDLNTQSIELVDGTSLIALSKKVDSFVIIDWYPKCRSAAKYLSIAEHLDKQNVPVMLLSPTYHINEAKALLQNSSLKNKNIYIIQSEAGKRNNYFDKKIALIQSLAAELYQIHKDELLYYSAVVMKKDATPKVYINYNKFIARFGHTN